MNRSAFIFGGIILVLSSCQTSVTPPQPATETSRIEVSARHCAAEVYARKEKKKAFGQISWNTNGAPGSEDGVPLDYAEVSSDGAKPGQAWRSCMLKHGVDTSQLILGERDVGQARLANINMD